MAAIDITGQGTSFVRLRFSGKPTPAESRAYIDGLADHLARAPRYVILVELESASLPTAPERREQAEFIKANRERLAIQCLGAAFVVKSAVMRGALTAVFWIQPLPYPHVMVADVDAAERWCRERLKDANLPSSAA